jgi:ribosome-associated protein
LAQQVRISRCARFPLDRDESTGAGPERENHPMPGDLPVHGSVVIPGSELSWRFSRASGPGGQGVNTTDSRVELTFDVAETTALTETQRRRALDRLAGRLVDGRITVGASEHRSQLRNRAAAEHRLAALLASAIAPPPRRRRPTKATKASVERRLQTKKRRSELKRDRSAVSDD